MKLTGNTILITGGGSGIGRGLAEALHRRGNQIIIAGRRKGHLEAALAANPGMRAVELDIADPSSIAAVARQIVVDHPALNVLINNAGIMAVDDPSAPIGDDLLVSTITTNLMGPIRLTSALIDHLKKQDSATIVNVSSVLGYVPMAFSAVYSATKAAIHSYSLSQRFMLRGTSVKVQEIAPPWVRTDLLGSNEEPRAMPLDAFIEETMVALGTDAEEVLVERARALRANPGPKEHAFVAGFNETLLAGADTVVA
jgi:uncharacterized oxidoreductase